MRRLEVLYSSQHVVQSGMDWIGLFRVIKDRYADRLELIRNILNDTTVSDDELRGRNVHGQVTAMIRPYLPYSMNLTSRYPSPLNSSTSWARPAFKRCSIAHTHYISTSSSLSGVLTPSERLLLRAAEVTNREICRTVTNMWVKGVAAGLPKDEEHRISMSVAIQTELFDSWKAEVERLMNWLDWSVWLKCQPACAITPSASAEFLLGNVLFGDLAILSLGDHPFPVEAAVPIVTQIGRKIGKILSLFVVR
uniref:Uncharacterized protein n=1 Tax=Moniliophthora roreri TaxID=221103 RepID=A0A0W0FT03_MONRR